MGILADEAGDVGLLAACQVGRRIEEGIEFGFVGIPTTHQIDMTVDVLRHEETILVGVGLGQREVDLRGVEGTYPATVAATLEELVLRVVDVLVGLCAGIELVGDVLLAHGLGHAGHAPVVVGIFKRLGDRLAFHFDRDVAVSHVGTHAAEVHPR